MRSSAVFSDWGFEPYNLMVLSQLKKSLSIRGQSGRPRTNDGLSSMQGPGKSYPPPQRSVSGQGPGLRVRRAQRDEVQRRSGEDSVRGKSCITCRCIHRLGLCVPSLHFTYFSLPFQLFVSWLHFALQVVRLLVLASVMCNTRLYDWSDEQSRVVIHTGIEEFTSKS